MIAVRASAATTIAAPPAAAFAFVGDLRNHGRLGRRYVTLLDIADGGPDGGWVRVSGPLRQTRRARTRLAQAVPPADGVGGVVEGTARTTRGTTVRVGWRLSPH